MMHARIRTWGAMRCSHDSKYCKHNVAQTSLFWIRNLFWPQHPRCRDPMSNHIKKPDKTR